MDHDNAQQISHLILYNNISFTASFNFTYALVLSCHNVS